MQWAQNIRELVTCDAYPLFYFKEVFFVFECNIVQTTGSEHGLQRQWTSTYLNCYVSFLSSKPLAFFGGFYFSYTSILRTASYNSIIVEHNFNVFILISYRCLAKFRLQLGAAAHGLLHTESNNVMKRFTLCQRELFIAMLDLLRFK